MISARSRNPYKGAWQNVLLPWNFSSYHYLSELYLSIRFLVFIRMQLKGELAICSPNVWCTCILLEDVQVSNNRPRVDTLSSAASSFSLTFKSQSSHCIIIVINICHSHPIVLSLLLTFMSQSSHCIIIVINICVTVIPLYYHCYSHLCHSHPIVLSLLLSFKSQSPMTSSLLLSPWLSTR